MVFSLLTAMLIEVLNSFKVFRGYTSYIAVKILLFCEITYISYYSRESLQAEFDEQVLRLNEMEQQLNYKRDECEV